MSESVSQSARRMGVIVLAGIGAITVLLVSGMAVMHGSLMGGGFVC